jgi:hypothetical protein
VADHLAALAQGAALVVLETVSRLHDGPETNEGFRALIASLERIALATRAAIAVVRHTSKKAGRDLASGAAIDSHVGRGGSAFSDAVRSCLVVTRAPGLGPVKLTAAKTTHAQEGQTISWQPVVVQALDCVRLDPMTRKTAAMADVDRLCGWLAMRERGCTMSTFNKETPPGGLTRDSAKEALEAAVTIGRVIPIEEKRGNNIATVYYLVSKLDPATLRAALKKRRTA